MVGNQHYNRLQFYWFWLGSKIFFKREWELNKRCFKIVDWSTCCTLLFGVEEIYMQNLSGFLSFFWWQKVITFKSSVDLYFHPLIIDLPSYGSESRKRYTLMLLLMCIKARRSTNDLPGWKVCLRGMRGRKKVWVGSPFLLYLHVVDNSVLRISKTEKPYENINFLK